MESSTQKRIDKAIATVPSAARENFQHYWQPKIDALANNDELLEDSADEMLRQARRLKVRSWARIFIGSRGWFRAVLAWVVLLAALYLGSLVPVILLFVLAIFLAWFIALPNRLSSWLIGVGLTLVVLPSALPALYFDLNRGTDVLVLDGDQWFWIVVDQGLYSLIPFGWIMLFTGLIMSYLHRRKMRSLRRQLAN